MSNNANRYKKKTASKTKQSAPWKVWEKVPPHHLALLHKRREKHLEQQRAERVKYPNRRLLRFMTEDDIRKLGFTSHDLKGILGAAWAPAKRKRRGGKGKHLPNPQVVAREIKAAIAASGLTPVGMEGDIVRGEQNLMDCDLSKVQYFHDSYTQLIPLAHIWLLSEVSKDAVAELSRITGYVGFCADENSRGQASAILVHPNRLAVVGQMEQIDITNIQGVQDLRKAALVNLKDNGTRTDATTGQTVTGKKFWVCSVHGKSMRGGEQVTSSISKQQYDILANVLPSKGPGCLGGDFNRKLPAAFSAELLSLKNAGFVLVDPTNTTWTQAMGSWLDGFLTLDLPVALGKMTIIKWWQVLSCRRDFDDHATVTSK